MEQCRYTATIQVNFNAENHGEAMVIVNALQDLVQEAAEKHTDDTVSTMRTFQKDRGGKIQHG